MSSGDPNRTMINGLKMVKNTPAVNAMRDKNEVCTERRMRVARTINLGCKMTRGDFTFADYEAIIFAIHSAWMSLIEIEQAALRDEENAREHK